jgi:23S rRNA pseudouridine1911/1915/1917 synthase
MPEAETRSLQMPEGAGAERLDRMLARAFPDLSRSRLQALIREGRVSLSGAVVRAAGTALLPATVSSR